MKKLLAWRLALVMVLALAACGNDDSQEEEQGGEGDVTAYKVAMITDYGDITDQSFNQTTYEACQEFCTENNLEFTYYKPNGDSTAERVAMVDAAVADGYNVVVRPGYAFAETIKQTAEMYPNVSFIALDVGEADLNPTDENGELLGEYYEVPANVYCAVYQEELCGYMAGYAAVKDGFEQLGFSGGGGGTNPACCRYGYGFLQGASAAAVEMGVNVDVMYSWQYGGTFSASPELQTVLTGG